MTNRQQQALELIQSKAHAGYKDLEGAIKRKLYVQQPVKITTLIGQSAIIDKDIMHQLRDAAPAYHIDFIRINLSQPTEIMTRLREYDRGEKLILSRGGGEHIQLFNNIDIAKVAFGLRSIFVTAIGHSDDESLLQKVADKAFITPTSLGQYLYDTYVNSLEETSKSKARLITDITRQVELNVQHKINDLNTKLSDSATQLQEASANAENQMMHLITMLANEMAKGKKRTVFLVIVFILLMLLIFMMRK